MSEQKISEERMKELLEMERKAKQYKATADKAYKRRNARINIILTKAEKAGIRVTDAEVDEYLKAKK